MWLTDVSLYQTWTHTVSRHSEDLMAITLFSCVSAEAEFVLYLSQDSRVTAHFPLKALRKTFQMTNFFKNMSMCTVTLSTHLAVSLRGMHLQFLMTSGSFR